MQHYRSWADLKKRLEERLCPALQGHVTYFLTCYHDVHNAYGRAAVRCDGRERVCFAWQNLYKQEQDVYAVWKENRVWDTENPKLKQKWEKDGTYCEGDFLFAALSYLQLDIQEALHSENALIRLFAILDKRIGKRTLQNLLQAEAWQSEPDWLRPFCLLRFEREGFMIPDRQI